MERRVGKKASFQAFLVISIFIFSIFFVSCPNPFDGSDIRSKIADEVEIATTPDYKLIVESTSYGVSDPSGTVEVKEGFPIVVTATPFTTHGLVGWEQTSGPGTVTFSQAPGGVEVSVSSGNASIRPMYAERPRVLYSTPIGNDIERNSNVALVFSTQVDLDSINSSTFKLLKSGIEQITDGVLSLSADGKIVKFNPDINFNMYTNYVISVESEVNGFLNIADYEVGNTIITSDTLNMGSTYTSAFRTGSELDNTPPVAVSFTATGTNDDPNYTGSEEVTLSNIFATDSAGIAYTLVKNSGEVDYQAFSYDMYPEITWPVPLSEGWQDIIMSFEDSNGLIVVGGTELTESIIVDFTAPTGTITVDGYGSFTEFIPTGTVNITLFAQDPDVDIGVKGSGESTEGTTPVNRKEMRFANTSAAISGASWEAYATTKSGWTLSDSLEGTHTVYVQYKDAVENNSPIYKDTIYLDTTAPTGSFQIMNDGLVTNKEDPNAITLDLSMSDGTGSGLYELQIEPSSGLKPSTDWSTGGAASGTLQGDGSTASAFAYDTSLNVILQDGANSGGTDGSRIINLKVFDGVGNFRTISQTITLDTTPPTGGSISINNGTAETNSANVTLYITPPTGDLTGIAYMAFSNTNTPEPTNWIPAASTASWTLESASGGTKNVYAWFKDTAGNISATPSAVSDNITLDMTPPSGTITVSPSVTALSTVTLLCNVSGATQMRFSNNNVSWSPWESYASSKSGWNITSTYGGSSANGTRYVYAQFRDAALNVQSTNDAFTYDNTKPTVSSFLINSNASATNYYYVTLTQSATDNVYSTASLQMRFSNNGSLWTGWYAYNTTRSNWLITSSTYGGTTAQGTKSVYIQVRDPMNNISTSRVDYITYDTVRPATSPVINSGNTYTNYRYVTITLNASDASPSSGYYQMRFSNNSSLWSGWQSYASTRSSWDITSSTYGGTTTEGYKYVYVQLKDWAGNISTTRYDYIKYDITPPSGSFYFASGNPSTTSYMYTYVYFNMTDSGSGVAQRQMYHYETGYGAWETYTSSKAWYVSPKNGFKYVYAKFKDGAGNITSLMSDTVTLAETYSTLSKNDISSSYPGYTYSYYMNANAIEGDDAFSSSALKPGTVLVYRTSAGRFGKLEILNFYPSLPPIGNNILQFKMTTYNSDGSVYVSKTNVLIRGTYSCDLDTGTETSTGRDFFWRQNTSTQRDLVPTNGALFAKWK